MRHIICLLMENQPGALSRVVGLFSQRGFNIETLNVAPTSDNTLSRLTLSTDVAESTIGTIQKHLNRLVDVAKVESMKEVDTVHSELILIKLKATPKDREALKKELATISVKFIDIASNLCSLQFAGSTEEINALIAKLDRNMIIETVRGGVVGLTKSEQSLRS